MKKETIKKVAFLGLCAIAIIVTFYQWLELDSLSGVLMAAGIAGLPSTSDTPTVVKGRQKTDGIYSPDISGTVTRMMPGRTPIDTIMRRVGGTEKSTSQIIDYYQAAYKPMRDKFDSSAIGDGSGPSSACSSYTYTSGVGILIISVKVLNPDIWRKNDTLLLRDLTLPGAKGESVLGGTDTHKGNVMFYVSEKSGPVLTLIPIGGVMGIGANSKKRVVPNFSATSTLIRMGQAKSELSITTDPFAIYPEKFQQYTQNFMAQIEESTFNKMTEKNVKWGFSDFEATNVLSMKMEMELSMLFGQGGLIEEGNDATYFTRGIVYDIKKNLTYGTGGGNLTVSQSDYNEWLKQVFDGNNGSTNRILFAGSGLLKSIAEVKEFQKQIIGNENRSKELGVDVRTIHNNFGTLDIVHCPLFKEADWEDHGIILDIQNVSKHSFIPMTVTELDLKRSGQKNADARVIQEVSALILRYPDCHAIISPKA